MWLRWYIGNHKWSCRSSGVFCILGNWCIGIVEYLLLIIKLFRLIVIGTWEIMAISNVCEEVTEVMLKVLFEVTEIVERLAAWLLPTTREVIYMIEYTFEKETVEG